VEGVVEVNWALDPKKKEEYRVIQKRPQYIPEKVDVRGVSESKDGLHVRLNEACIRLDSGIRVNFKVDNRERMQAVRFEIRRRERAKCGWSKMKNDHTIQRKYYELNPDDWGRWKEMQIGEIWKHHIPFRSQLFSISYHLKVTLEIGWDFDPAIIIPVTISDSAPEPDVFDEIAKDVGFDDW
jgi:hypothetical protein